MADIWLPIQGFANLYEVCNNGRVRRITRTTTSGDSGTGCTFRYMRGSINKSGYLVMSLSNGFVTHSHFAHRIVAMHFLPSYREYLIVHHVDDDILNNNVDNLECISPSESARRIARRARRNGDDWSSMKLDVRQVSIIRKRIEMGWTYSRVAQDFNVSTATIFRIANYISWIDV
jgi:hypothetical protein